MTDRSSARPQSEPVKPPLELTPWQVHLLAELAARRRTLIPLLGPNFRNGKTRLRAFVYDTEGGR